MANDKKLTLSEELDSIPFRNRDIAIIHGLKNENMRLKDQLGRNREQSSTPSAPRIQGLETLKGSLGKQFKKGLDLSDLV